MILPKAGFLEGLRKLCDQYQAVLIFDEVMTGFRVHAQGAQGLYDIKPDLTCFGKIIGGGMPVGALGGRKDIMDCLAPLGPVYQAGTLSGNPVAMAAGLASLQLIKPDDYQKLHKLSQQLVEGLIVSAKKNNIVLQGHYQGGMFGLFFNDAEKIEDYATVTKGNAEQFKQFFYHMLDNGVYFAPSMYEAGFVSTAHNAMDIANTVKI